MANAIAEKKEERVRHCPKCGSFLKKKTSWDFGTNPGWFCGKCDFEEKIALDRRFKLDEVLSPTLKQLIADVPENPSVRVLLGEHLARPVPDQLTTFDQLSEWIEVEGFNGDAPPAKSSEPILTVDLRASYTEYGRCEYSQTRVGYGTREIPMSAFMRQLQQLIRSSDTNWQTVCSEFHQYATQMFDTGSFDTECEQEETNDHEVKDTENHNIRLRDRHSAYSELKKFIADQSPALWEELERRQSEDLEEEAF